MYAARLSDRAEKDPTCLAGGMRFTAEGGGAAQTSMKTTVTTTEAQANLPRLLRQPPAKKSLTITSHGRIAGFLVSKDRMEAIIEAMEILANPKAMKAIRDLEARGS